MGHAQDRALIVRLGRQQEVVRGDGLVVLLQVPIRGADLQVDHRQRRRARQDRAVDADGVVELLLGEQGVGGGELLLQILGRDTLDSRRWPHDRLAEREGQRRLGCAGPLNVQLGELGLESGSFRHERPLASRQADDGEPALVVGGHRQRAKRGVGIVGADRRPFDGLTGVVLDETADASDLGSRGGRRSHDERDGDEHTQMVTHLDTPAKSCIHGGYRASISRTRDVQRRQGCRVSSPGFRRIPRSNGTLQP